jgi:hypothetical protein
MKWNIRVLTVVLLAIFVTSCSKKDKSAPPIKQESLYGYWEMFQVVGNGQVVNVDQQMAKTDPDLQFLNLHITETDINAYTYNGNSVDKQNDEYVFENGVLSAKNQIDEGLRVLSVTEHVLSVTTVEPTNEGIHVEIRFRRVDAQTFENTSPLRLLEGGLLCQVVRKSPEPTSGIDIFRV